MNNDKKPNTDKDEPRTGARAGVVRNDLGQVMNPVDSGLDHKGLGNAIPPEDDHAQIREDNVVDPDGTPYTGPKTVKEMDESQKASAMAEQARQDKLRSGK